MADAEKVLVTGGTGFIGLQIILQLLQKGYRVNTTVRSLKSKVNVIETLKANGISNFENLSFFEAELTNDANWATAMQGCKYVLSVASPVFFDIPKDEQKAMQPAIEGTLRVLKFAKNAGTERVVMTSSFGALGFSHTDKNTQTTEADWTDPNLKGLSAYEKSKILSERAAWNLIKTEANSLQLTVINPVAILGPSLNAHISGSFIILQHLLDGSMKAVPHIPFNIIDVRDVADLHIRAMTNPGANGQRFIASADGQISMPQMAKLIKDKMPAIASKVSGRTLPDWVVHLGALFNETAKAGSMFLKVNRNISNEKAKKVLGWTPVSTNEEAILAALESMVKYGLVK